MPVISLEAGRLSEEVKKSLIERLTEVASEITTIPKASFIVAIHEMPDENVGVGGKTVREMKEEARSRKA
jgi:4-oxalocrotonate tautomerase